MLGLLKELIRKVKMEKSKKYVRNVEIYTMHTLYGKTYTDLAKVYNLTRQRICTIIKWFNVRDGK